MTKSKHKKHPKAPWTRAASASFAAQAARLRPESGKSGGIKARSGSEAARVAVYRPIAELFLRVRQFCEACGEAATETHHLRGRGGLLLFDTRYFMAVCKTDHAWIHRHPAQAREKGWLAGPGKWNKAEE